MKRWNRVAILGAVVGIVSACGSGGGSPGGVSGSIQIDGSSTVFPITEAVAEEFMAETGGSVRVSVAISGTGGGFRRFCTGETDISNASRPILAPEEETCAASGVEFVNVPVAWDGMAVMVSPENDFVECLTVDELRRIWEPESTVQQWSEVRPEWPDRSIRLYGPGTTSGTFDYFTEEITGAIGASRSDYTASEDDNVLVQGVSGDANSLGYFGYAYYVENESRLKLIAVDSGSGCVSPSTQTIESGEYAPLSRPLYLYVNRRSLERPEIASFLNFYIDSAGDLAQEVGYVPLGAERYDEARVALAQATDAQ